MMPSRRPNAPPLLLAALLALAGAGLPAQPIYRSIDPNGRVIFSDQPPIAAPAKSKDAEPGISDNGNSGGPALPFELRQVVERYPVMLYSGSDCAPCDAGRSLLSSRGVPFTERTVNTGEDADALRRLSGSGALPFLSIGGQPLRGFSDTEWTQFLDAAGYPKSSRLPLGYRLAPATPLVTLKRPSVTQSKSQAAAPAGANAAPLPTPTPATDASNPAGIRF